MSDHKSYHHKNLPAELLRLGLEAIEQEGTENLSLRALSERAGVSKTAPYRHFTDKDDFLAALADEGYRLLYEALKASTPEEPRRTLPALGRAYFAFALERPALYRLMTSPIVCVAGERSRKAESDEDKAAPGWPRKALLFLAECLERDIVLRGKKPQLNPDAAAATWAYIHGLVMIKIDGLFPLDYGEPDWELLAGIFPPIPLE
jgi:AcrR family transcriptional regulator